MPPEAIQSSAALAVPVPLSRRAPHLVALGLALLGSWALYALVVRPWLPSGAPWVDVLTNVGARAVFWGVPCAVYLWRVQGARWWEPLGLGFPYGRRQVVSTLIVPVIVAALSIGATARQLDVPVDELLGALLAQARPRFTAPLFEELVFRGVVVSEALSIARESAPNVTSWRWRYWGAQLAAAGLFTLVHWPWWLMVRGLEGTLAASLPVFATGLILGVVFGQTRSLWPCILLHWIDNELSVVTL